MWSHISTVAMSCSIFANAVAAAVCGCVFVFAYHSAAAVVAEKAERQLKMSYVPPDNDVLCPCLFGKFTSVQFTMGITVATVGCFCLAAIAETAAVILNLALCDHCDEAGDYPLVTQWLVAAYMILLATAYVLMFVTHFERLRLTFKHTSSKLPKWAPNVLYATLLLAAVMNSLTMTFLHSQPVIAGVCMLISVLIFSTSVSALIGSFFKKTMAVVSAAQQRDDALKETAVRVTLSVAVALLSSTATQVLVAVWLIQCPLCWTWILVASVILAFDSALNAFCLLCTFHRAAGYYQFVFGRVHSFALLLLENDNGGSDDNGNGAVELGSVSEHK